MMKINFKNPDSMSKIISIKAVCGFTRFIGTIIKRWKTSFGTRVELTHNEK